MVRGPRKHLKRLNAPKHWMLDKLSGTFAPRPSPGPHKLRECLPLVIFLRNRLKYALTAREATLIVRQRIIKVDGRVRRDPTYPAGFMDVVSVDRSGEHFRLLFDVKGRYAIHRISKEEAAYKLCRVKKTSVGPKGVPFIVTHDGRTIRYPDPSIKVHDSIKLDLKSGRIDELLKFETGNLCFITGGRNIGRVGNIVQRERHHGGFDIIHVKDAAGRPFATRMSNVFIIGKGTTPYVSLPDGKGVKLTILEERDRRLERIRSKASAKKDKKKAKKTKKPKTSSKKTDSKPKKDTKKKDPKQGGAKKDTKPKKVAKKVAKK